MRKHWVEMVLIGAIAILLSACSGSVLDKYQLVSDKDGNLTFLDTRGGKVYYVNKSGNIVDVVDLRISAQDVQSIKKAKDARESSQKNRDLGEQVMVGTNYKLSAQIRYYKDRLLYHFEMKPYDANAFYTAATIRISLLDQMGFTLEKIDPSGAWAAEMDSKGNRYGMVAAGEVPMTLDNFLEVDNWLPVYRSY